MVSANNTAFDIPTPANELGSFSSYSSGYSVTSNVQVSVSPSNEFAGYQFPQQQCGSASSPPVQMVSQQPISYSYSTPVNESTPTTEYMQPPVYTIPSISPITSNCYASSCSSFPSAPSSVRAHSEVSEISLEPELPSPVDSGMTYVVLVQFKWGRQGEFLNNGSLALGTHVIVTADRGRDIGMVVESRLIGSTQKPKTMQKVVRIAKTGEITKWRKNISNEEKAAKRTCQKVMAKVGIVMKVMHAEYQFDMKKITFHFSSQTSHPDFRPVLDSLYSIFRCRIWFARYSNTELDKINRRILTGSETESEVEEELSDIELPLMAKKKSKKNKKKANKRKANASL
eukprot:TRINITY_DN172_c2_g2_i1.p1 TRINITY_DN172_c2_g2~~TRINITY_DN172_c2_g2_i1.p1  ORF type:complete len:343 (+),score=59.66 TRINITY_DN172_c2_g2_i1:46-1074(+)